MSEDAAAYRVPRAQVPAGELCNGLNRPGRPGAHAEQRDRDGPPGSRLAAGRACAGWARPPRQAHHRARPQLHWRGRHRRPDAPSPLRAICDHCVSIAEDRHVDVIEMDAASRTGIDDVRELIESVRYRPVSARYKVYIIDEVHMLSKQAFNALLKTLEEPPPHVKFVFATTEVRRLPVTVLSRCQRFDLRRVDMETLVAHFGGDRSQTEGVGGGARGARSHRPGRRRLGAGRAFRARPGDGPRGHSAIAEEAVRAMLGLADPDPALRPLRHADAGRDQRCARLLRGAPRRRLPSPRPWLQDLLELCHWLTRLKLVPAAADDPGGAGGGTHARGAPWRRRWRCRSLTQDLADAAQGAGGGGSVPRGRALAAGDDLGAHRLRRRPAEPGGCAARPRRGRRAAESRRCGRDGGGAPRPPPLDGPRGVGAGDRSPLAAEPGAGCDAVAGDRADSCSRRPIRPPRRPPRRPPGPHPESLASDRPRSAEERREPILSAWLRTEVRPGPASTAGTDRDQLRALPPTARCSTCCRDRLRGMDGRAMDDRAD